MTPSRLNTLTSLRYFFAVGAVAIHLIPVWANESYSHWPAAFHNLLNAAYIALPFFYALSGFVLFYMYRQDMPQRKSQLLYFWGKRFARLAPIFYLSLMMGLSVLVAEKGYGTSPREAGSYLLVNLAFLSAWLPESLVINFPTWSVSVEMFCYFLFPFFLPPIARLSKRSAWAGVLICVGLGAAIQVTAALAYPALWRWPWDIAGVSPAVTNFFQLHPLVHLPEFLFGIFLARAWEQRRPATDHVADLILLSGFALIAGMLLSGIPWPFLMLTSFLFLPAIGLLLWGGAGKRGRYTLWLEFPLLLLLGEASYAVYGFHMPLSYWFSRTLSISDAPYKMFFLFLSVLTGIAIFFHRLYELRARAWLMGRIAGWRS
ncbi:MAG: acyltransferase family protein [Bacteriovoracia bacterium]